MNPWFNIEIPSLGPLTIHAFGILVATGILVGLYLPVLASHFATPEKIRVYAIVGAALVLIGTACEVFAVWPVQIEMEQQPGSEAMP